MIYDLIEFDTEWQKEKGKGESDALEKTHFQTELIINEDGSFKDWHILDNKMETYREARGGRTCGVRAFLLLDKAAYTLGLEKDGTFARIEDEGDEGYAAKRLRAYVKRLKEFEELESVKPVLLFYQENRENGLEAAKRSLSEEDIEKLKGSSTNIAFRLPRSGQYIHENKDVIQELESVYQANIQKNLREDQYCSLCGENDSPIIKEPHGGIKGIPGGLANSKLVSYKKESFKSYGLEGSLNSFICERCAKSYTRALNTLVNDSYSVSKIVKNKEKKEKKYKYREKISNDSILIFWCKNKKANEVTTKEINKVADPSEEISFENLAAPVEKERSTEAEVHNLVSGPKYSGNENMTNVNEEAFYACVLAGVDGRIAVKDWIQAKVGELKKNVKQWFDDIELERGNKEGKSLYSIQDLINFKRSGKDKDKDKGENDGRAGQLLWHAALMGGPLPLGLLSPLLHSVRMGVINEKYIAPRISLIKAILNRNLKEGGMKLEKELNENEKNSAYICGRIFSVFEAVQDLDGPKNAGIVQRFFSAASSSPAVAFSRLFKLNKHHLEKLSKDSKNYWEKRLGELCEKIENAFPEKLALKDQGYFALGYYHEKFKKKEKEEDKKDE